VFPVRHERTYGVQWSFEKKTGLWEMSRIVIVGLTSLPAYVSRLSRQCGIFNISQAYRPPRPVTGIAMLYFYISYSVFYFVCFVVPKRMK
jgi:hypothetical protein